MANILQQSQLEETSTWIDRPASISQRPHLVDNSTWMDWATAETTDISWDNETMLTVQTPPVAMQVLVTLLPIVTIVFNMPTVVLVVVSIIRKKKVRNFHLLSLGISDSFVGLSSYLMAETYKQSTTQLSYYHCWMRYYLFSITFVASMLHVLGICIQRVRFVLVQLQHQDRNTVFVQWTVIIMSWVVSLSVNTIPFSTMMNKHSLSECSIDEIFLGNEHAFMYYIGSLYALVQFLVLSFMFFLIRLLTIHRRKFQDESWSAKDVKLCATVAILACLFTACTLPLTTVLLCYDYLGVGRRTKRSICVLLALLNSVVNPVIYILRVKEFRNIMKPSACCTKQNHVSPYSAELENPEYLQHHPVGNIEQTGVSVTTNCYI